MNINIVCIGKIKESFYREAVSEYAKRLTRFCKFNITELQESRLEGNDIQKVKINEGKSIISKLKGYVIILDLAGEMVSSTGLAEKIDTLASKGVSEISFVIGGSYGLSDEVKQSANCSLCFGKVTYPHQLMRVILSEQIYRAYMINSNSEYHK
ncbi:MAG: 23S rRNA (pseudouridine(1915)-N(3))-methyltransferase RlmH [Clostridia bacterium]|nr:23S rRNA (pseudouridine(1915)-N(3))-methyltransferase RlmH [Clostridia bacterium]